MRCQTAPNSSLGLPCGLYRLVSNIEGMALPNGCFYLPSAPHNPPLPLPFHPLLIESIRDIIETEKDYLKISSIQVTCRISYNMIAAYNYITAFYTLYLALLYHATRETQCI